MSDGGASELKNSQFLENKGDLEHLQPVTQPVPLIPSSASDYYHENQKNLVLECQINSAHDHLRRLEESFRLEKSTQLEVDILRLKNEIRKLKLRLSQRKRIATENTDQREHRLAILRMNQRKRLANETPERRQQRLKAMREYALNRTRIIKSDQGATEPFIDVECRLLENM